MMLQQIIGTNAFACCDQLHSCMSDAELSGPCCLKLPSHDHISEPRLNDDWESCLQSMSCMLEYSSCRGMLLNVPAWLNACTAIALLKYLSNFPRLFSGGQHEKAWHAQKSVKIISVTTKAAWSAFLYRSQSHLFSHTYFSHSIRVCRSKRRLNLTSETCRVNTIVVTPDAQLPMPACLRLSVAA